MNPTHISLIGVALFFAGPTMSLFYFTTHQPLDAFLGIFFFLAGLGIAAIGEFLWLSSKYFSSNKEEVKKDG